MIILFHKRFGKAYKKSSVKIKGHFRSRLALFAKDPFHPLLNNHALHGNLAGYRSINITGDIRAIYKVIDEGTVEFALIGSHGELYGG